MAPVTLPENKVQDQEIQDIQEDQELEEFQESESRSDFHELKISAQILAYHAFKFMLPAVVVIVTLACGITLSVWALNQLNKLPIQAFPASVGASDQNKADLNNKDKLKDLAPTAVHAPAQKKARKAKTQAKAHNRKYPQRHSNYQDPWADYYYEAPSHPRGGEIIHSDGMVTEYRWAKKR